MYNIYLLVKRRYLEQQHVILIHFKVSAETTISQDVQT